MREPSLPVGHGWCRRVKKPYCFERQLRGDSLACARQRLTKLGIIAIVEDGLPLGALTSRRGLNTRQRRCSISLRKDNSYVIK